MCHKGTPARLAALLLAALAAASGPVLAQSNAALDWRRIGNTLIAFDLPSPATGPLVRVRFAEDGSHLFVESAAGSVFRTTGQETWEPAPALPPAAANGLPASLTAPARGVRMVAAASDPTIVYAWGADLYRSEDGGRRWQNLTRYRGGSILGAPIDGLAVSPVRPDEIAVVNRFGVWRSADGGLSWRGLNAGLPGFPSARILSTPQGMQGMRIAAEGFGALEWVPEAKDAWQPVRDDSWTWRVETTARLSAEFGAEVRAAARTGSLWYAGASDGRIWVSLDEGSSWTVSRASGAGAVNDFWIDPNDPYRGLAALGAADEPGPRVLRTTTGGLFWDDLSADLPGGDARGIAADPETGSVYVATRAGIFTTHADLLNPAPASPWTRLEGLPEASWASVALDREANQLYVAAEGRGLFATLAPHRTRRLKLVSAADLAARPAAPGALLSLLGAAVSSVQAGPWPAPVLAARPGQSEIQIPFEVTGDTLPLAVEAGGQRLFFGLPLRRAAPAIFVDQDGAPLLLDGDSELLLDAMNPARSGSRVQIFATGLGAVEPHWRAGVPAPGEDPPKVAADVRVYLDRAQTAVTRATLAPGYQGMYLVEILIPEIVNQGPAELYLEIDGIESNRVRVYLEP